MLLLSVVWLIGWLGWVCMIFCVDCGVMCCKFLKWILLIGCVFGMIVISWFWCRVVYLVVGMDNCVRWLVILCIVVLLRGVICVRWLKFLVEKFFSFGEIRMLVGFSEVSDVWIFCLVRMLSICLLMFRIDDNCLCFISGVLIFIVMMILVFIVCVMFIGKFLVSMLFMSNMLLNFVGVIVFGMDMLVCMILVSLLLLNMMVLLVIRLVVIVWKGIGSLLNW